MADSPVAVITGAGGGIGRTLALGLAADGYRTVLAGRSRVPLEDTARAIMADVDSPVGCEPRPLVLDLVDQRGAALAVERVVYELGRVDILVNNAGQWRGGSLDASLDDYRRLLDVNLLGPLALTQAVIETMTRQGHGYLFNVSSRAGKVGFARSGAYCASKFALVGLNESLYRELTPRGIRVTALCPGWVNTGMAEEAGCPHPLEAVIQPEDLMATVRWCLSLSAGACVKEIVLESPISIV